MSDHIGPPHERGMFVKEAYLHSDVGRAPAEATGARSRAIDTVFAEALSDELGGAYRLAGYLLAATHNNWLVPLHVMAAIYLLGVLCWLLLDPVTPLEPVTDEPSS